MEDERLEEYATRIDELEKINAALMAACEAVAAHIDPDAPYPTISKREAMLMVRAALALARPTTPTEKGR